MTRRGLTPDPSPYQERGERTGKVEGQVRRHWPNKEAPPGFATLPLATLGYKCPQIAQKTGVFGEGVAAGEVRRSMSEATITIPLLLAGIGCILVFFGGGGGWVLYWSLMGKKKASASKDWPCVHGKMITSQIKEVTYYSSDGPRRSLQLEAKYEYTVGGIQYINNKHTLGRIPKGILHRKTKEIANRYAPEAIVPVYYNPQNPQESCLEREAPMSNVILTIGLILLAIAACGASFLGVLLIGTIRFLIPGN
jgi:hypothetical protein